MKTVRVILAFLFASLASVAGADRLRLDFNVTDNFGQPVKGAKVNIVVSKYKPEHIWAESGGRLRRVFTDEKGNARESFPYFGTGVFGYVQCEGYHEERIPIFALKTQYDVPTFSKTVLEHQRSVSVVMKKRINPIPLYSYCKSPPVFDFGTNETAVAYDLKRGSYLPPYGTGKVADFYIHHQCTATNGVIHRVAEMIFPDGGGAYVVKRDERLATPMVYRADPEKEFRDCVYASRTEDEKTGQCLFEEGVEGVLGEKDALVIRSRAERDETGKVVRANYSKIYGPLKLVRGFEYGQTVFNPNVNDTNLELNASQNLAGRKGGIFYP